MKTIERRVEKIEKSLSINQGEKSFRTVFLLSNAEELPEPIEEWMTYKEELAKQQPKPSIFFADSKKELEARRLLKATKDNKTAENI